MTPPSLSLTVACFNIRNGLALDGRNHWLLRRRRTLRWIRDLDADVLGLQEVHGFQRRAIARALPDHALAGRGRGARGMGEQVPILLRPPLSIEEIEHRWFGDTPTVPGTLLAGSRPPRITTTVTARHPASGMRFRVLNTHLDHRDETNRVASARQLVRDVRTDLPAILLGDFNTRPGSSGVFEVLADAGWRRLRYEGSSFNGWRHGTDHPSGQIDQILVRDGDGDGDDDDVRWVGENARLVTTSADLLPSDHWPLVADLELARPT